MLLLLQAEWRPGPRAPHGHPAQILFPAWVTPDHAPYFLHTHRHMNGQANLHGAEMFKWVNTGLWATGTRMGWGVEKKCGESPHPSQGSPRIDHHPQGMDPGEAAILSATQ